MRKLARTVLRNQAYIQRGGIELFHHYWKTWRIGNGKSAKEDKPVKRLSALHRALNKLIGGKNRV